MRGWVFRGLVIGLVAALLIAPDGRAGASEEPAVVPYLPEELGAIPGELILFDDRSGYWAGVDAPRVRYLEFYRNQSMLDRWIDVEIAPGVILKEGDRSILLFYYLGDDGSWHQMGYFSAYTIQEIELRKLPFSAPSGRSLTVFSNFGGNNYFNSWLNIFSFVSEGDSTVKLIDNSVSVSGIAIREISDIDNDFSPEFIGYAGWQLWGDVCHAASPDRQLILSLDKDGVLVNVSSRFPEFYVNWLALQEKDLQRQVNDGYARRFNDTHNDYYIGYAITTLIYYHDMGKHDEGVERARELFASEYFESDEEYEAKQALIDAAVEKLAEQDAAIQASIDEYNAAHAAGEETANTT